MNSEIINYMLESSLTETNTPKEFKQKMLSYLNSTVLMKAAKINDNELSVLNRFFLCLNEGS